MTSLHNGNDTPKNAVLLFSVFLEYKWFFAIQTNAKGLQNNRECPRIASSCQSIRRYDLQFQCSSDKEKEHGKYKHLLNVNIRITRTWC